MNFFTEKELDIDEKSNIILRSACDLLRESCQHKEKKIVELQDEIKNNSELADKIEHFLKSEKDSDKKMLLLCEILKSFYDMSFL